MVGFNTPRTFNRAFIKQTGVSPTEYRRRWQEDAGTVDFREPTSDNVKKEPSVSCEAAPEEELFTVPEWDSLPDA